MWLKKIFEKLRKKNLAVLLLVFPLAVYFFFGFQHLAKFETADEHYWIYSNNNNNNYWNNDNGRINQYWSALAKWDLKKTRINDKPGITVALVSGPGAWLKTRLENGLKTGVVAPMTKMEKAEKINLFFRVPLLLFNGLFVFVLFYLLRKLLKNEFVALLASTFMLLSPVIVGVSQIVNPDSLLWSFSFASILSFLIYLQEERKRFSLVGGIFFGLSLLTKYSSVILIPFFLLVTILYIIENIEKFNIENGSKKIAFLSAGFFITVLSGLALYAILLPDNLVNAGHFFKGSIGFKGMFNFFIALFGIGGLILFDVYFFKSKILFFVARKVSLLKNFYVKIILAIPVLVFGALIVNTISGNDFLGLFNVPFDASVKHYFAEGFTLELILRQFLALVFSLSPIVIFFALYALIKNMKKRSEFGWVVFILSLFVLVYVIAVTIQSVPLSVRYSIMLYPAMFTLGGIGAYQMLLEKRNFAWRLSFFFVVIVFGSISLGLAKPFYFNYTSLLLPKNFIISDAWGYGGYEAAAFLNSQPDVSSARIWSDYNGVCLFFNGSCSANKLTMQNIREDAHQKGIAPSFEYFVSSRRGHNLSAGLWENLFDEYGSREVFYLEIAGRRENFIKVFKNDEVDFQKFQAN